MLSSQVCLSVCLSAHYRSAVVGGGGLQCWCMISTRSFTRDATTQGCQCIRVVITSEPPLDSHSTVS